MYGSDKFAMSLPRPFPVYVPRPSVIALNKTFPSIDDFGHRVELPQSSSTEDSSENRAELLASSEMREFTSCFSSYVTPLPTTLPMPPACNISMPQSFTSMVMKDTVEAPEVARFRNTETNADCEGTIHEDDRKHEKEHRKRSKNWTRLETLKLIQIRTSIDAKFGCSGKKSELWDQIGEALQKDGFSRDAQQCKDKWEKLSASYKEVRDGIREKEDFPFYENIHSLMSGKFKKREREVDDTTRGGHQVDDMELDFNGEFSLRVDDTHHFYPVMGDTFVDIPPGHAMNEDIPVKKRKNELEDVSITKLQELMDFYLEKQRRFFAGLLDEVEKREQLKEKLRQEREDKWRDEEREQRRVFTNAMIFLTQTLLGEASGAGCTAATNAFENTSDEQGGVKKRSKNWKKSEVLQLIKLRIEMDSKLSTPMKKGVLWEGLAESLGAQGIHRDGKQCREKWEKLMAELKDVADGKRDECQSPFLKELKTFMEEGYCHS